MYLNFKQNSKNNILQLFSLLFILKSLYNGQNCEFLKHSNWNMPETPSKMHMYDMVKIEIIVFEIVGGGGGAFKAPPPRIVSCRKYPGSDRVKFCRKHTDFQRRIDEKC